VTEIKSLNDMSCPEHEKHAVRLPVFQKNRVVVSYPRSGRTWLRFLFHDLMRQLEIADKYCALVTFKHDGAMIWRDPKERYRPEKGAYKKRDVLLMVRNPRAVMVSLYYFLARRKCIPWVQNLSLSKFVRHELGLAFLVRFMNDWARNGGQAKSLTVFAYEDMRSEPAKHLDLLVKWIGLQNVTPEMIQKALDRCSIDRMREVDAKEWLPEEEGAKRYTLGETSMVREARVGGFRHHFSEEDLQWMDRYIDKNLSKVFGRYRSPTTITPSEMLGSLLTEALGVWSFLAAGD
jgi:hypothetical protein